MGLKGTTSTENDLFTPDTRLFHKIHLHCSAESNHLHRPCLGPGDSRDVQVKFNRVGQSSVHYTIFSHLCGVHLMAVAFHVQYSFS